MKLVRTMFWLLIGATLSLALVVGTARAEYMPKAEFLAKMQKMVDLATPRVVGGEFQFKEVKAGKTYRDGDVAYFSVASDGTFGDSFIQLEEWRIQPDSDFQVTYTKMWPNRAVRWTMRTNNKRRIPTFGWEEKLDITSAEAIAASERAQQLLRDHGRPVMVGGVAI